MTGHCVIEARRSRGRDGREGRQVTTRWGIWSNVCGVGGGQRRVRFPLGSCRPRARMFLRRYRFHCLLPNHTCCCPLHHRPSSHCAPVCPPPTRLREKCRKCPNTAWLLFLLFSVGLVCLAPVSVYLSRKRLNLAVLGIGVVRVGGGVGVGVG